MADAWRPSGPRAVDPSDVVCLGVDPFGMGLGDLSALLGVSVSKAPAANSWLPQPAASDTPAAPPPEMEHFQCTFASASSVAGPLRAAPAAAFVPASRVVRATDATHASCGASGGGEDLEERVREQRRRADEEEASLRLAIQLQEEEEARARERAEVRAWADQAARDLAAAEARAEEERQARRRTEAAALAARLEAEEAARRQRASDESERLARELQEAEERQAEQRRFEAEQADLLMAMRLDADERHQAVEEQRRSEEARRLEVEQELRAAQERAAQLEAALRAGAVPADSLAPPAAWGMDAEEFERRRRAPAAECELVQVARDTDEWRAVLALGRWEESMRGRAVLRIQRIVNAPLWYRYALARHAVASEAHNAGEANEMHLWHGARATELAKIWRNGIDFRYANKGSWGSGAYTAFNAAYSEGYATPTEGGKQFFLARVCLGKVHLHPAPHDFRAPPDGFDSVEGRGGGSRLFIVYDNARLYPEYLVTFK